MSNMLFLCRLPENCQPEKKESDKTLLRVYFNPETETHLVAESVIFTLLSERKLGPRLFGIFNGGRLEEYIVSRPLTCYEIREPEISSVIARKLAIVHQLDVPIVKQPDYICEALDRWMEHLLVVCELSAFPLELVLGSRETLTLQQEELVKEMELVKWLVQLTQSKDASNPILSLSQGHATNHSTKTENGLEVLEGNEVLNGSGLCSWRKRMRLLHENLVVHSVWLGSGGDASSLLGESSSRLLTVLDLSSEFQLIKRCICKSRSPVNFCHNDLQEGNILLPQKGEDESCLELNKAVLNGEDKDRDGLVFIDFEYASYNYRGFDFANHFCEWPIDYTSNRPPYFSVAWEDFPSSEEQKTFFRAYLRAEDEEASKSEEDIEREAEGMLEETAPFVPVSHFFWGVWALLQVELSPVEFGFAEYGRKRLGLYFQTRENMLKLLGDDQSSVPSILSSDDGSHLAFPKKRQPSGTQNKNFLTVN